MGYKSHIQESTCKTYYWVCDRQEIPHQLLDWYHHDGEEVFEKSLKIEASQSSRICLEPDDTIEDQIRKSSSVGAHNHFD